MEEKGFRQIIRDEFLVRVFKLFLEERYCSETLSFWLEVEAYRKSESQHVRSQHSRTIWDKYFEKYSIYEINVPQDVITRISDAIKVGNYSSDLFDESQKEIETLLEFGQFPDFILSDLYKRNSRSDEHSLSILDPSRKLSSYLKLEDIENKSKEMIEAEGNKIIENKMRYFLRRTVEYIMDYGLSEPYLFSTPLSNPKILEILQMFINGENIEIPKRRYQYCEIAGALRYYLLEVDPYFDSAFIPSLLQITADIGVVFYSDINININITNNNIKYSNVNNSEKESVLNSNQFYVKDINEPLNSISTIRRFQALFSTLPEANQESIQSLLFLMYHLHLNYSSNQISFKTLAKVMLPTFFRASIDSSVSEEENISYHLSSAIIFLIQNYTKIYDQKIYNYGQTKFGYLVRKLVSHKRSVTCIIKCDDNEIWSCDTAGVICIWNSLFHSIQDQIVLNSPLILMKKYKDQVWCISVKSVYIVHLKTRKVTHSFTDQSNSLIFLGDTAWFCGNQLVIRNALTFDVIKEIPLLLESNSDMTGKLFCKSICLAEEKIWCGLSNGFIIIFDLNGEIEFTIENAHLKAINDILYVNNNNVWTCSDDNTIAIWSNKNYRFLRRIENHKTKILKLCYLHTTSLFKQQIWSCSWDQTFIWNSTNFSKIGKFKNPNKDCISDISFSFINDKEIQIWAASFDHSILVYNLYFNRLFKLKKSGVVIGSADVKSKSNQENQISDRHHDDLLNKYFSFNQNVDLIKNNKYLRDFLIFFETLPDTVKKLNSADITIDYSRAIGKDKFLLDQNKSFEEKFGGTIGISFKGKWKLQTVAVKKIFPHFLTGPLCPLFISYLKNLVSIFHPNILLLIGLRNNKRKVYEYMEQRSLQDLIDKNEQLTVLQRLKIAKEVAQAMAWLHCSTPPITHGSLFPSNILLDGHYRVKVADFGLLPLKEAIAQSQRGNQNEENISFSWHVSPEILLNISYDHTLDQYSYAVLLWQLWNFKNIYVEGVKNYQQMVNYVASDNRLNLEEIPTKLRSIINSSWHSDLSVRPSFTDIISLFNHVIIDCTILDTIGRDLWAFNFFDQEEVVWNQFLIILQKQQKIHLGPFDPRLPYLKAILDENQTGTVEIETFGNSLWWFGPLANLGYVDRIFSVLQEPWFHGNITREEAEAKLNHQDKPKTFLVRFSSEPGCYSISVLLNNAILHYRILHEPGGSYQIGDEVYPSLKDLIVKSARELNLKYPCPNSKYLSFERLWNSDGYELFKH